MLLLFCLSIGYSGPIQYSLGTLLWAATHSLGNSALEREVQLTHPVKPDHAPTPPIQALFRQLYLIHIAGCRRSHYATGLSIGPSTDISG